MDPGAIGRTFAAMTCPELDGPAIIGPAGEISYDLPVPEPWRYPERDPALDAIGRCQRAEAADSTGLTAVPGIPSSRTLDDALVVPS